MKHEQVAYWNAMTFDTNINKVESSTHDVQTLGEMLGFTAEQMKDHFKCTFPPHIKYCMYKAYTLTEFIAIVREMVLTSKNIAAPTPTAKQPHHRYLCTF